jgi:hypothetical protein
LYTTQSLKFLVFQTFVFFLSFYLQLPKSFSSFAVLSFSFFLRITLKASKLVLKSFCLRLIPTSERLLSFNQKCLSRINHPPSLSSVKIFMLLLSDSQIVFFKVL